MGKNFTSWGGKEIEAFEYYVAHLETINEETVEKTTRCAGDCNRNVDHYSSKGPLLKTCCFHLQSLVRLLWPDSV